MNELDLLRAWTPTDGTDANVGAAAEARDALATAIGGPTADGASSRGPGRRFAGRALVAAAVTVALAVGAVAIGNRMVDDRIDHVKRVKVKVAGDGTLSYPMTVLLVGSDSRAFVQDAAQANAFGNAADTGGARSDTMMLVRLEANRTTVVSLPRDLVVDDGTNPGRPLNSYFNDGPQALIDAIRDHLGVTVDHYLELDFAQFVKVVDAVGGIRMTVPTPIRDRYTGLDIATPGCTTFDGDTALAFVRSRHLESLQNGRWVDGSPRADLDRISRQQRFLEALLSDTRNQVGDDLDQAFTLAERVARSMTVDAAMSRDQVKDLARRFIGQGPSTWTFSTLPVEPSTVQEGRLESSGPTGAAIFGPVTTTTTTPQDQLPLAALGLSC